MENKSKPLIYKGDNPLPKKAKDRDLMPYIPSPSLVKAVNLAIFLKRPLLLMGEPGCGKTRLAEMVACELDLPYQDWYITSNSKAKDGLYRYDALRRLHDAQAKLPVSDTGDNGFSIPERYFSKGPLWLAFEKKDRFENNKPINTDKPAVVLIDEIDKADIDFPNDLLRLLDEKKFTIDETGETIPADKDNPPIIFITSNGEKPLPKAFLRRCLFHYIKFPEPERLVKIAKYHCSDAPKELASAAVERFMQLRAEIKQKRGDATKKPSTSEFLDWLKVLIIGDSKADSEELLAWFEAFYTGEEISDMASMLRKAEEIPFPETLLKDQDDYSQ